MICMKMDTRVVLYDRDDEVQAGDDVCTAAMTLAQFCNANEALWETQPEEFYYFMKGLSKEGEYRFDEGLGEWKTLRVVKEN